MNDPEAPYCGSCSVFVYDPATGDERCPRCWRTHPDNGPAFMGGQGHSGEDVEGTGEILWWVITAAFWFIGGGTLVYLGGRALGWWG